MRRLFQFIALAILATAAPAQQSVMILPLKGTGAGLQRTGFDNQSGGVVTGPLSFYGMTASLATSEGPGWLMVWDASAVPADGAVTTFICIRVEAGPRTITFGSSTPLSVISGLAWAFSSGADCQTKTAVAIDSVAFSYKLAR